MKHYLFIFISILFVGEQPLMAAQIFCPTPIRPADVNKLRSQRREEKQKKEAKEERSKELKRLLDSDENYVIRLNDAVKDTMAYIIKYQLNSQEPLHICTNQYMTNYYPDLSFAEYEYVLDKSNAQLNQYFEKINYQQELRSQFEQELRRQFELRPTKQPFQPIRLPVNPGTAISLKNVVDMSPSQRLFFHATHDESGIPRQKQVQKKKRLIHYNVIPIQNTPTTVSTLAATSNVNTDPDNKLAICI